MAEHLTIWMGGFLVSLIFLSVLGLSINKRLFVVLIDSRGKMSLSRLQLSHWTILIVSTLFSVSITYNTMNIIIPTEIWALMGISLGSAVSAGIAKGVKSVQEPSESFLNKNALTQNHIGLLHANTDIKNAKIIDIFKGDEVSEFEYIDISKVQMFFFTLAAWMGYASTIYSYEFSDEAGLITFPMLSTGIVTLIGVSHTGYIAIKASDKTPKK